MGKRRHVKIDTSLARSAALMWVGFVYLQASRLEEAVDRFHDAETAHRFVADFEAQGRPTAWAGQARKAKRSLARLSRTPTSVGPDKYFFLLSVAQLVKCVESLAQDQLPGFDDSELVRHLRNIEEHWENPAGPSWVEVRELIPDIVPGRITFNKRDIWFEGISFVDTVRWVRGVELKLRSDAVTRGAPLPEPPDRHGLPQGSRVMWAYLHGLLE